MRSLGVSLVCVIATAATTGWLLTKARALQPSTVDAALEASVLPAQVLKVMSLGFRSVAADAEFLSAIQVFGDKSQTTGSTEIRRKRSRAVAHLLDYATEFDPYFSYAYVFGANSIPISLVDESDFGIDEAIRLLEKGTLQAGENCRRQDPSLPQVNCDWRVPFYLAYLTSSYEADFRKAAEAMADSAQRPGHPEYIEYLATRLAAVGGAVETGLDLCHAMELNAESEEKKAELSERCRLLEMERDLRKVEDAITVFMERQGRRPNSLGELVEMKFLDEIPPEPHGGAYVMEPATGQVRSSAAERLRLSDVIEREIDERKRRQRALQGTKYIYDDSLRSGR